MVPMRELQVFVDAGISFDDEPSPKVAVRIYWRRGPGAAPPSVALFCLPGGSINSGYYDLGAEDQPSFSFARQMAAHGLITVAIDHLGVGASTRPTDLFALTPDVVAAANANATQQLIELFKSGRIDPDLPALPDLATIGVGHSMGGLLTALQQATYGQHRAIALLGYSNNGLIQHLPAPAHRLIDKSEQVAESIQALAREIYASGWPEMVRSEDANAIFYGSKADRDGITALKAAGDKLLIVPGLQSMIPGNMTHLLATITVPVFLGLGDLDIAGSPHAIPGFFGGSKDISLFILPDTGHCHFIFPSRRQLFDRIAHWVAIVGGGETASSAESLPTV